MKYGAKKMNKKQVGGPMNRPSAANPSIKQGMTPAFKATDRYTEKMLRNQMPVASKGVIVGMNGNASVQTVPGSKGVMTNVNPSVQAQTGATGYRGGISSAPLTAMPNAKLGGMLRKKK
jgi:hypothetical protein